MSEPQTPRDFYEKGYESAKQRFAVEYARIFALGTVVVMGYMVYKFIDVMDTDTLETFAIVFFGVLMSLFGLGGSLAIVTIFRYIQKPGIQLPGKLGDVERRLGLN